MFRILFIQWPIFSVDNIEDEFRQPKDSDIGRMQVYLNNRCP